MVRWDSNSRRVSCPSHGAPLVKRDVMLLSVQTSFIQCPSWVVPIVSAHYKCNSLPLGQMWAFILFYYSAPCHYPLPTFHYSPLKIFWTKFLVVSSPQVWLWLKRFCIKYTKDRKNTNCPGRRFKSSIFHGTKSPLSHTFYLIYSLFVRTLSLPTLFSKEEEVGYT